MKRKPITNRFYLFSFFCATAIFMACVTLGTIYMLEGEKECTIGQIKVTINDTEYYLR